MGCRYTCPMKEIAGELYSRFKNQWHRVWEYTSELTSEFR
nr:MAG TPA: 4Fe-4S binding domain protein [Caudoviricetes sp.]